MIKKLICLCLLPVIIVSFVACSPKPRKIVCTAMFSKNNLELPILGVLPNAPGLYDIKLSIDEIFSKLSEEEFLTVTTVTRVDDKIYISKDNGDGTKDYFTIRYYGEGNYYEFFDMGVLIHSYFNHYQRVLFPYHLVETLSAEDAFFTLIKSETEYETQFGAQDFFDFYNDSGWYDVEMTEDNYFLLKGYVDDEKVYALNNTLWYPLRHMEFGAPLKFEFFSSEEPNINYFVVS